MLGEEVSDDTTEVGQEAEDESQASRSRKDADRRTSGATEDNQEGIREHSEQQVQSHVGSEAVSPQLLQARGSTTRKWGSRALHNSLLGYKVGN